MSRPQIRSFVVVIVLLAGMAFRTSSVTPVARVSAWQPAPTGKIVFVSTRDGNKEIYVMNADGTNPTRITDNPADDDSPAWSPDGTKIAFSSNRADGNYDIWVVNADGTNPVRLTDDPMIDYAADWSPDGSWLTYTNNARPINYGVANVWRMNADGSNKQQLTDCPQWCGDSVISPDGTRIAFGFMSEPWNIMIIDANGGNMINLTNSEDGSHATLPAWSPDGQTIAFAHLYDEVNYEIVSKNLNGDPIVRLTFDPAYNDYTGWSPDGQYLTFATDYYEIFVMNPDGSGIVNISNNNRAYQDYDPDWAARDSTPPDTTPPDITPTVQGILGNAGWYTSDVLVTWAVSDGESAISSTTGCGATNITSDTAGVTVTCSATSAGGTTTQSVTIKRDVTSPTAAASAGPPANANGWRKNTVTVTFTGTDALSGGVTCDPQVVLSTEGSGQSATGQCYDAAGNESPLATASGINIDKTGPVITVTSPAASAVYNRNQNVVVAYSCSDGLSGPASCTGPVTSGQTLDTSKKVPNGKFTVNATDKAGNVSKVTISYSVK